MDGGKVTYKLEADDSGLDRDLAAAERKIKDSAESSGEASEKEERQTSKVLKEEKESVAEHHKKQNDAIVEDDKKSGDEREANERSVSDRLKSITATGAKAVGASFLAAGAGAVTLGTMAVKGATDLDAAMNQYIASTGKGTEETERYRKVMEDIYTNNYGDSFEDIGLAMAEVTKQLGDMDDASLQNVTESAYALRDTFGYDIPESTRAAKAMMDNFGVSGDEAMSLIAAGAQNGLDYSGELIDSISEYSVQFAKVGLNADDMFAIFQKGAETGAWNLDKIGDAVKEMAIRVVDGSDATKEGFESIGLDADAMSAKFAAGGQSAKDAFKETVQALASVKDPLAQNAAGVALFGTMWEDLGPEVVTQLADIEGGAYDTADAMEGIKAVKYDDLGSMFEGLKRSIEVLLIPLGEQLIPVLSELIEEVLPVLQETLPPLLDVIMACADALIPIVEVLLPVLLSLFEEVMPVLQQILEEILPVVIQLIENLAEPLLELVSALLPPLLELVSALIPIFQSVIDLLMPIIDLFIGLLDPVAKVISEAITPLIQVISRLIEGAVEPLQAVIKALGSVFSDQLGGMMDAAKSIIQSITQIFGGFIDFIAGVFTGDWSRAWEGIVSIFEGIVSGIANIFKAPINFIIDGINGFINGLNKIKIPDWVPVVGGKGFHISTIPRLKIGMDYVPSDYFPAYLDKGEMVLTQPEAASYRAARALSGGELERAASGDVRAGMGRTPKSGPIQMEAVVSLNDREIARATAEYTGQQQEWEEL
ncbi:MAG: hypothetical protein HFI66_11995 [Lachnospiraceae bacterium]|jgi:phage-related minor tail protein|nr:hypothetical protein [Lachnospiraceae bacterium]